MFIGNKIRRRPNGFFVWWNRKERIERASSSSFGVAVTHKQNRLDSVWGLTHSLAAFESPMPMPVIEMTVGARFLSPPFPFSFPFDDDDDDDERICFNVA